ncbi:MAG TPA: GNAT family N-acetyltransferase [Candidatus Dormibacteraeota bacterium]|nr:GNAT family N-acetyltransferase [Candidatus Dormibacteraeota bacterium]
MAVDIRELRDIDDLRALAELFAVIWGRPGDPPVSAEVLKALAHSRNYVTGAFRDGRLVGGLVGWFGGLPDDTHLHSHILGVLPDSEARGLGFELKQHQRRWCLDRGVTIIEWTTDPLVRRNAYFNLTKLGARAAEYMANVYGVMGDEINAGEESDRLLIRWQLDSSQAEAAAAGQPKEPDLQSLHAEIMLEPDAEHRPSLKTSRGSSRVLMCRVPEDIVELRRHDRGLAREWRLALRHAFTDALDAGYEITGANRSGWYVLETRAS